MKIVTRTVTQYLGYDETGEFEWKDDVIDAVRFSQSEKFLREWLAEFLEENGDVVDAPRYHGHYELYNGYEIQIFQDDGDGWAFHLLNGPLIGNRKVTCTVRYDTSDDALLKGRSLVNEIINLVEHPT